jgi:hypothetical protein
VAASQCSTADAMNSSVTSARSKTTRASTGPDSRVYSSALTWMPDGLSRSLNAARRSAMSWASAWALSGSVSAWAVTASTAARRAGSRMPARRLASHSAATTAGSVPGSG